MWIDHREARVFHIALDHVEKHTVRLAQHLHRKQPHEEKQFFHELCVALDGSDAILVVGPSTAKLDFMRYVHKSQHVLEPKIVGIETVDHPTGGQLVAYAKQYFGLPVRTTTT